MFGLLLVLICSLVLVAVGAMVDGLFWLTLIGIALFLATAALGEARTLTRIRHTAARG